MMTTLDRRRPDDWETAFGVVLARAIKYRLQDATLARGEGERLRSR